MEAPLQINRRQVSEYFLRLEASKGDCLATKLASSTFPNDADFFREYRAYADRCKLEKRDSPVLVWTVGVTGDNRFQNVQGWQLEKISLEEFYSCAMGKNMHDELEAVSGNLKAPTHLIEKKPDCYSEFDLTRFPDEKEKQIVIRKSSIRALDTNPSDLHCLALRQSKKSAIAEAKRKTICMLSPI